MQCRTRFGAGKEGEQGATVPLARTYPELIFKNAVSLKVPYVSVVAWHFGKHWMEGRVKKVEYILL